MSDPGLQAAMAAQLQGPTTSGPGPQGAVSPQGGAPGGNSGGLGQLAQAYARCEQTKSCTPEDFQVLKQGLPQLMEMAKNIQGIIQAVEKTGGPAVPPQQGAPQPGQQ